MQTHVKKIFYTKGEWKIQNASDFKSKEMWICLQRIITEKHSSKEDYIGN